MESGVYLHGPFCYPQVWFDGFGCSLGFSFMISSLHSESVVYIHTYIHIYSLVALQGD